MNAQIIPSASFELVVWLVEAFKKNYGIIWEFFPNVGPTPPRASANRDKARIATKVRESSMINWGTFDSKSLFKGGTFDSSSLVLKFPEGTFEDYTTTKSP